MIYIIVGKSCSGKTSAKEFLESRGLVSYEASKYMKDYTSKFNVPPEKLFENFGKDFVSKLIFEEISNRKKNEDVVISGLRTVEEILLFKDQGNVKIICIESPDELCFKRNLKRDRKDVVKDFSEYFNKRIVCDSELGLDIIFRDYIDKWINNEDTLKELHHQLNKYIFENETN